MSGNTMIFFFSPQQHVATQLAEPIANGWRVCVDLKKDLAASCSHVAIILGQQNVFAPPLRRLDGDKLDHGSIRFPHFSHSHDTKPPSTVIQSPTCTLPILVIGIDA
jgi:hypothetical protein